MRTRSQQAAFMVTRQQHYNTNPPTPAAWTQKHNNHPGPTKASNPPKQCTTLTPPATASATANPTPTPNPTPPNAPTTPAAPVLSAATSSPISAPCTSTE